MIPNLFERCQIGFYKIILLLFADLGKCLGVNPQSCSPLLSLGKGCSGPFRYLTAFFLGKTSQKVQEERVDVLVLADNQFDPLVDDPRDERHLTREAVKLWDQQLYLGPIEPPTPWRRLCRSMSVS